MTGAAVVALATGGIVAIAFGSGVLTRRARAHEGEVYPAPNNFTNSTDAPNPRLSCRGSQPGEGQTAVGQDSYGGSEAGTLLCRSIRCLPRRDSGCTTPSQHQEGTQDQPRRMVQQRPATASVTTCASFVGLRQESRESHRSNT